jgi:hypothetical protein
MRTKFLTNRNFKKTYFSCRIFQFRRESSLGVDETYYDISSVIQSIDGKYYYLIKEKGKNTGLCLRYNEETNEEGFVPKVYLSSCNDLKNPFIVFYPPKESPCDKHSQCEKYVLNEKKEYPEEFLNF